MQPNKRNTIIYLAGFLMLAFFSLIFVNGCDDSGVENNEPATIPNPNVKIFDSLYIEEDSAAGGSFAGVNLWEGYNTNSLSPNRDCGMSSGDSIGMNFFLRTGILDKITVAGYETKFYRFYANMTSETFDTLSFVDAGASLDSTDFTQEDTYGGGVWGYFNAPLDSKPVYGFYLRGRKGAGQNNGIPIYGLLQPITSGDRVPGTVYGFWMTFKIRMNIKGENDFRRTIPNPNFGN